MLYLRNTTSIDANTNFRFKFYAAATVIYKAKNAIYDAIDNSRIVHKCYTMIIINSNKRL